MQVQLSGVFAAALKGARQARRWTQAELAERAGMAVEAYGRLERGLVLPRAQTLVALAEALNTSTDFLLGRDSAALHALRAPGLRVSEPDKDSVEVRRLIRRLRKAKPRTIRLASSFVAALEDK